jgi:hypothetical protein
MKNLTYVVLALILAITVIASCKKSENPTALNEKSNARKVTDTVPTHPTPPKDTTKTAPLTGDKITLQAGLFKSSHSDTGYVYFVAHTSNLYCASGKVNFTNSLSANNNFSINLINAQVPITCIGSTAQLSSGVIAFWQNSQNPYLVNGSYPISVTLNGSTYTGSMSVSPTTITFNWTYTTGVVITPTQLAR